MTDVPVDFQDALDELRFEDAAASIADLPAEERLVLDATLRAAREEAIDEAELFANRIQLLAREDHYAALYDLSEDPMTERRLSLLPDELSRGAFVHLNGARRRREQSLRSARGHLDRAREALDSFHTGNARRALSRVDEVWLTDDEKAELAALRERLDFVKAEADELNAIAEQTVAEHESTRPSRLGRGCASSTLLVLAVLACVVALVI